MSTVKDQKTLHANHAVVKIGGQVVARLQNIQVNRDSGADYVYEVGSIDPVEINHNRRSVRVSVSKLIFRQGGPAAQFGRFELGELPPFEITFQDRDYGNLWSVVGCEVVGDSASVSVSQRVAENLTIMALKVNNLSK
ncbi:hypothetical protein [Calidithermus chliarophilus]|uniref:hypothetical protein n=1 Tax=Calidithermus chliarophilus TaxID=52023 RepID=UPI000428C4FB|nr:hypothetical protein [Calidithermus chliarophilus]